MAKEENDNVADFVSLWTEKHPERPIIIIPCTSHVRDGWAYPSDSRYAETLLEIVNAIAVECQWLEVGVPIGILSVREGTNPRYVVRYCSRPIRVVPKEDPKAKVSYIASYTHDRDGSASFQHCTVTRDEPLDTPDDVEGLVGEIRQMIGCKTVVLLNIIRLPI